MAEIYKLGCNTSTDEGGFIQLKFRSDRLEELMRELNLSQSELARRVGVSQATVWKLLNEPIQGSRHLHKIAAELGVSPAYLMGEIDEREGEAEIMAGNIEIEELSLGELGEGRKVKGRARTFAAAWLAQITSSPPGTLCVLRDVGGSMAPTIGRSDLVFIDRSINRVAIADQVYAVSIGGAIALRRLRPKGEEIVIMSDRPEITDQIERLSEIKILGRVVAKVRSF